MLKRLKTGAKILEDFRRLACDVAPGPKPWCQKSTATRLKKDVQTITYGGGSQSRHHYFILPYALPFQSR